jgi:hypothetical protein
MNHRKRKNAAPIGEPSTWTELILYLVPGIGLYFLSLCLTIIMLTAADKWTVLHSFIIYSLNAIGLVGVVQLMGIRDFQKFNHPKNLIN